MLIEYSSILLDSDLSLPVIARRKTELIFIVAFDWLVWANESFDKFAVIQLRIPGLGFRLLKKYSVIKGERNRNG
jgi:hypothetical protein